MLISSILAHTSARLLFQRSDQGLVPILITLQ